MGTCRNPTHPWNSGAPPLSRAVHTILCVAVALLAPAGLVRAQTPVRAPADAVHLVVLHTNDVHGQALARRATWIQDREVWVGGLGRVAAYVAAVRAEHRGERKGVLVLDGGDWFQGTPEGQVDGGLPFLELMLEVGYDALVAGNHEWDLGAANLKRLVAAAGGRALCANVRERVPAGAGTESPGPRALEFGQRALELGPRALELAPFRVVRRAGLDIAIVGLVARETPFITHRDARDFDFIEPVEEFGRVLGELPEGVDLVIPLSHCGVDADRALASAFPDLALIVGGHSHTFLREPVRVGATRLVQAGAKATVVGRVDLWIDPRTKRVVEVAARLVDLEEEPAGQARVPRVERGIAALVERAADALDEVVATLVEAPHPGGPLRSSGLGNWIADTLRSTLNADVGIHNKGGIRAGLAPGPITRRAVFEVVPFENTAVAFDLSGAEILALVRRSFEGQGRRGFEFSGMTVHLESGRAGTKVSGVRFGVNELDPDRTYRVATNSFLATGGDRLFEMERPLVLEDSGMVIRDMLAQDLAARSRFTPSNEDRVVLRGVGR